MAVDVTAASVLMIFIIKTAMDSRLHLKLPSFVSISFSLLLPASDTPSFFLLFSLSPSF